MLSAAVLLCCWVRECERMRSLNACEIILQRNYIHLSQSNGHSSPRCDAVTRRRRRTQRQRRVCSLLVHGHKQNVPIFMLIFALIRPFCLIVPAFPQYWPHFQILLHTCQAHAQNVPSKDTPLRTACSGGEQSERRIISSVLGTEAGKMVIVTSCEGLGMQTFSWS